VPEETREAADSNPFTAAAHELREVLASHIVGGAERPRGKHAALDEAICECPADACCTNEVLHGSPVFPCGRTIRCPRFAVPLEILGPDSAGVPKTVALELASVDQVVDRAGGHGETLGHLCDRQEVFGPEKLALGPPQIRRKLLRERLSTGSTGWIRWLILHRR
jgi:hypothetical protein